MDLKDIHPGREIPVSPVPAVPDDRGGPVRGAACGEEGIEMFDDGCTAARAHIEPPSPDALAPDRLMDVRRRLQSRYYDTPEVAEEVARRIIARGDL